jgi:hypothetical protein
MVAIFFPHSSSGIFQSIKRNPSLATWPPLCIHPESNTALNHPKSTEKVQNIRHRRAIRQTSELDLGIIWPFRVYPHFRSGNPGVAVRALRVCPTWIVASLLLQWCGRRARALRANITTISALRRRSSNRCRQWLSNGTRYRRTSDYRREFCRMLMLRLWLRLLRLSLRGSWLRLRCLRRRLWRCRRWSCLRRWFGCPGLCTFRLLYVYVWVCGIFFMYMSTQAKQKNGVDLGAPGWAPLGCSVCVWNFMRMSTQAKQKIVWKLGLAMCCFSGRNASNSVKCVKILWNASKFCEMRQNSVKCVKILCILVYVGCVYMVCVGSSTYTHINAHIYTPDTKNEPYNRGKTYLLHQRRCWYGLLGLLPSSVQRFPLCMYAVCQAKPQS